MIFEPAFRGLMLAGDALDGVVGRSVEGAVQGAVSGCLSKVLFWGFLVALVIYLVRGFHRVPIGAKGIVIWMGRRTGEVRGEGITWMPPVLGKILTLYVRERQIDVPQATYHTADRARIAFKTTVRVVVEEPAALLEQGPGTFGPFLREGYGTLDDGAEEKNVALYRLMQNSIREAVHSLTIHDVMFGGPAESQLQQRIRDQLARTTRRWGLGVREVWLTEIEADDRELERAVQAEIRESMEGRGKLAAQEAEVAKGALFGRVAEEMVRELAAAGREVPYRDAVQFLRSNYQNERELEIALRRADNVSSFAHEWIVQAGSPRSGGGEVPTVEGSSPRQALSSGAALVLGREGHIRIDGDGVSRHHARIELKGDNLLITDLGSTNGTFVGGEKLPAQIPTVVTPSSEVRLGNYARFNGSDLIEAARSHR